MARYREVCTRVETENEDGTKSVSFSTTLVPFTAEEEAQADAEEAANQPPVAVKVPQTWAAAYLIEPDGGAMSGAEEAARIDAIVYYDVGWYAVFFQMPTSVTTYYPRAWNEVANVHVAPASRADGYFEIRCKDANGVAIDPENFSVVIDIIA